MITSMILNAIYITLIIMIQMKFNILGAWITNKRELQDQVKWKQFYLHYLLLVHYLMLLTVENLE